MKTTLYFILVLIFIAFNNLNAQKVEGGGVVKLSLKTTPELIIEKVAFFDENNNNMIDGGEKCYFEITVKNIGKTPTIKAAVDIRLIKENTGCNITVGQNGLIWIGSYEGGLNRFDPKTNKFTNYKNDPNNPKTINNNFIARHSVKALIHGCLLLPKNAHLGV